MEVFVARQPVVDNQNEIFAYEILYRNNEINAFPNINGDQATADVLINSFLNIGSEKLTNGKPCFINFTENLLKLRLPTLFNPSEIVVEILESIEPSSDLIEICKELKKLGYQIALDDFLLKEQNSVCHELIQFVDIIKVDFLATNFEQRQRIVKVAKKEGVKLLAEKVENKSQFEEARELAFNYFQGFYFSMPEIISAYDVPSYSHSYIDIMQKLQLAERNLDEVVDFIETDLSLSYKLLKLINSRAYTPNYKIHSIRQAIVLLGIVELKKWVYIHAIKETTGFKNYSQIDTISSSLTRGKMCEAIAGLLKQETAPSASYMTGTISQLDSLMNISMEEILEKLPIHDDILEALQGKKNVYREILDLSIAVEKAQWGLIARKSEELELDVKDLFKIYAEATTWTNSRLNNEEQRL